MFFDNSYITTFYLIIVSYVININNIKVLAKDDKESLINNNPYTFQGAHYKTTTAKVSLQNQILIRNDIRRAFQPMKVKEDFLNHMVELMCKRIPEDPIYIFRMPMSENNFKNLIMHHSDFETPIYPNLTETHIQLAKLSKKIDVEVMPKPPQDYSNWFQKFAPYITSYGVADDDSISDEEIQDEIVKTNTVTETNFINYVLKINDKGEKYLKKEKTKYFNNDKYPTFKPVKYKSKQSSEKLFQNQYGEPKVKLMKDYLNNPKIDWVEFGVKIEDFYQPKYKFSSTSYNSDDQANSYEHKSSEIGQSPYDIEMPGDYGFFDKTEKNSVWDLPGKLSSIPLRTKDKYLVNNNDFLKNMTILLTRESQPHWSLTARKEAHRDSDIYISRANNPFGHSTKWQLRNHSSLLNKIDIRKKRGIKELYSMIKCSTGCDPIIYKGYGCFCGFMGSGVPVDGIDRCCKNHDDCYTKSNCPSYLEYFIPFLWKCYKGKPLCAYSHGEWGGPRSCASQLCQCDLELAKCLRKYNCPRKRAVCKSSYVRMIQNYLMIY